LPDEVEASQRPYKSKGKHIMYRHLLKLIQSKNAKICVLGLGYVGLPIAIEFVKKGFFVYGFDTKQDRIDSLKRGLSYIDDISNKNVRSVLDKFHPTHDADALRQADVVIICVPTPLRKRKVPDISYIVKASRTLSKYLRKGQLIILESTTYPGTTRDVVLPALAGRRLKEGRDFFLSFSPERIDPGNPVYTFDKIPKVVGGLSKESTALTAKLYSMVIKDVVPVSSAETAEIVKLLENTFRIVNIGLINEFAMVCDRLKIDPWEVVEAAKTKPFGFMPFYPGPGLGGHCIPADPLYLSWKARKLGFKTQMIDLAAKTNLFMPRFVVKKAKALLRKKPDNLKDTRVLILGVTYKKDIKDLRESPALDVIEILQKEGARVSYSDPYIPYLDIGDIKLRSIHLTAANLKNQGIVILVTDHAKFKYSFIAKNSRLIFDTRNAFFNNGVKGGNIVKL
jgi:UDP-N-acetyl-D-glucosamine dehydrogenase